MKVINFKIQFHVYLFSFKNNLNCKRKQILWINFTLSRRLYVWSAKSAIGQQIPRLNFQKKRFIYCFLWVLWILPKVFNISLNMWWPGKNFLAIICLRQIQMVSTNNATFVVFLLKWYLITHLAKFQRN